MYVIKTIKFEIVFSYLLQMSSLKNDATKKIEALEKDILKTSKINERKKLLKKLPFYNIPIDKRKIKKLTNTHMLSELLFYNEWNIIQTVTAFKNMQEVIALK